MPKPTELETLELCSKSLGHSLFCNDLDREPEPREMKFVRTGLSASVASSMTISHFIRVTLTILGEVVDSKIAKF